MTNIALQLYTVRDETARDFAGTLRRVAALGYSAVEFAGYGGLSASEMRALLEETGLKAAATHVGLGAIEGDLEAEIDYCLEIGCAFLVVPWLPPAQRTLEGFQNLAGRMSTYGRMCQAADITLGYHNHDFEFAMSGDRRLLDVFLDATDPAQVSLELDVYWAAFVGVDPVAYLQQHVGRIPLIHLKDMTPQRTMIEVGDGTLKLEQVYQVAKACGSQWFIVENDHPVLPSLESAQRSFDNIKSWLA